MIDLINRSYNLLKSIESLETSLRCPIVHCKAKNLSTRNFTLPLFPKCQKRLGLMLSGKSDFAEFVYNLTRINVKLFWCWTKKRKKDRDRHKWMNAHKQGWVKRWLNHHFCPLLSSFFFPCHVRNTSLFSLVCSPYTAFCSCRTFSSPQMSWCTTLRGCILF